MMEEVLLRCLLLLGLEILVDPMIGLSRSSDISWSASRPIRLQYGRSPAACFSAVKLCLSSEPRAVIPRCFP